MCVCLGGGLVLLWPEREAVRQQSPMGRVLRSYSFLAHPSRSVRVTGAPVCLLVPPCVCVTHRSDSRKRRGDVQQAAARERQRQVAQFNRLQKLEDKCGLCFKSPGRNEALTLAVGQSSYLSLMPRGKLVEGHCCIVPQEHVASMRQVRDACLGGLTVGGRVCVCGWGFGR